MLGGLKTLKNRFTSPKVTGLVLEFAMYDRTFVSRWLGPGAREREVCWGYLAVEISNYGGLKDRGTLNAQMFCPGYLFPAGTSACRQNADPRTATITSCVPGSHVEWANRPVP